MLGEVVSSESLPATTLPTAAPQPAKPPLPQHALLGVLLGFAALNLATTPLLVAIGYGNTWGELYSLMTLGAVSAQSGLHSIWFVFAPIGLARRLLYGGVAALILFGAFVLGFSLAVILHEHGAYREKIGQEVAVVVLCPPLLLLAVQSPLWLARIWFKWRVSHSGQPDLRPQAVAFGIRDILGATGCVSLALAGVRLAAPLFHLFPTELLTRFSIAAVILAVVSLVTTLPTTAVVLRAGRVGRALVRLLLLYEGALLGFLAVLSALARRAPPATVPLFLLFLILVYFTCLTGPLLLARRCGYRLVWGKGGTGRPC